SVPSCVANSVPLSSFSMSATYTLSAAMIFRMTSSRSPLRIGVSFSLMGVDNKATFVAQGTSARQVSQEWRRSCVTSLAPVRPLQEHCKSPPRNCLHPLKAADPFQRRQTQRLAKLASKCDGKPPGG